jgi:hypothetical protein
MENVNGKGQVAVLESPQMGVNLVAKRTRKIKRYSLVLTSVTAMLTDPMSDETLNGLRTGEKMQIDKTRTLEQICEGKLYLDDFGKITMPVSNMLASLNYAGKFFKYDRMKSLATGATSLIPSFLRIEGEYLTFVSDGWKPDQRRGRLDNGTAVSVVRPKFKNWSIELKIQLDDDEPIKIDTVIALFEKAGKASGLGSFRPSCKGAFGQFDVESCVEISLD